MYIYNINRLISHKLKMSTMDSINKYLIFTNNEKDMVLKDTIKELIKIRGVFSTLTSNGSKRCIRNKVEYYNNIQLKDINTHTASDNLLKNKNIIHSVKEEVIMSEYEKRSLELKKLKLEKQQEAEAKRLALEETKIKEQQEAEAKRLALEELKLKEQHRIEETKIKEQHRLEELKLKEYRETEARKLALEELKFKEQKAIELAKLEQQLKIKELEREQKKELKELDHAFQREENNKNRDLIRATRYPSFENNKYYKNTNIRICGTPANQYLSTDDTFKNLTVASNRAFHDINLDFISHIYNTLKEKSEIVPMLNKNNTIKNIEAINVKHLNNITYSLLADNKLNELENRKIQYEFSTALDYFEYLKNESSSPSVRILDSIADHDISIKTADASFNSIKDKEYYRNPINELKIENDAYKIKCYVCGNTIHFKNRECERLHDIPKSKNGNFQKHNIKLGCSNCNRSMSDDKTVYECRYELFIIQLKKLEVMIEESNGEEKANMLNLLKDMFNIHAEH